MFLCAAACYMAQRKYGNVKAYSWKWFVVAVSCAFFRLKVLHNVSNRVILIDCQKEISTDWINKNILALPVEHCHMPFSQHVKTAFLGMHRALLVLDNFDVGMEGPNSEWKQFLRNLTRDLDKNRHVLAAAVVCKKTENVEAITCNFLHETRYLIMQDERRGKPSHPNICDETDRIAVERYKDILRMSIPF